MQIISTTTIKRNTRPLLVCSVFFTALVLLSSSKSATTTTGKSIQDEPGVVPETTQTVFFANAGTLGAIPDGGASCTAYGANKDVTFTVSGVSSAITNVEVNISFGAPIHTWVGDLDVTLSAPGGSPSQVIFSRTGSTTPTGGGDSSNVAGPYAFKDSAPASPTWWEIANTTVDTSAIPAGSYRSSTPGGAIGGGVNTIISSAFAGLGAGANGTWTLRFRDHCMADTGAVSAASLVIDTIAPPGQKPVLDFDGDGKTDYAVVRNNGVNLNWYLQRSTAGYFGQQWGTPASNDQLVPEDYDGDNKWDLAVWRPGSPATFFIFQSATSTVRQVPFGQTGDEPRITQDFDGDGKADPAVVRNVGGVLTWYILRSTLGFTSAAFGVGATDVAMRGDYDGDHKADIVVYRFTTFTYYVLRSSDGGVQAANFGTSADFRFPADFDGDGKTDYAVWRGVPLGGVGTWYWLQSSDGAFRSLPFGSSGVDLPVPGDYDGDGKTDQAVWRPGTPSTFYVNRSNLGFIGFQFGTTGDIALGSNLQAR